MDGATNGSSNASPHPHPLRSEHVSPETNAQASQLVALMRRIRQALGDMLPNPQNAATVLENVQLALNEAEVSFGGTNRAALLCDCAPKWA